MPVSIYRYSNEMLKHIPQKALKTIENDLLYSETKVRFYINDNKRLAHYTRIVELNGRISMSCPYLLISIIHCYYTCSYIVIIARCRFTFYWKTKMYILVITVMICRELNIKFNYFFTFVIVLSLVT